jgi:serine/threonine-protein kinase RsbW
LSSPTRELVLTLPLRLSHLPSGRERVRDFLLAQGVHRLCIEDVLLAFTETIANAAGHSGAEVAEVKVAALEGLVRLTIVDRGAGFDFAALDLSQRPSPLSTGGRGLYLVSCVMDSVDVDSSNGTVITMTKHLRPDDCFPRAPRISARRSARAGGRLN